MSADERGAVKRVCVKEWLKEANVAPGKAVRIWRIFYRYSIELSSDRKTWTRAVDFTANIDPAPEIGYMHWLGGARARYVRVTFVGCSARHDASVREIEVYPHDPTW